MEKIVTLLLFSVCVTSHADPLVGYICDTNHDQLMLTYDNINAEDGSQTLKRAGTQWDPWTLVEANGDNISFLHTVQGECRLSDGIYTIQITPSPGNFNIQGRCGGWMTASATIKKEQEVIVDVFRFESDCHDTETPVTTRIIVKAKNILPKFETISWNDFYK